MMRSLLLILPLFCTGCAVASGVSIASAYSISSKYAEDISSEAEDRIVKRVSEQNQVKVIVR